jgi:hypothetical protein
VAHSIFSSFAICYFRVVFATAYEGAIQELHTVENGEKCYHVKYDDGDSEDIDQDEINFYIIAKAEKPIASKPKRKKSIKPTPPSKKKTKRKEVGKNDVKEEAQDEEEAMTSTTKKKKEPTPNVVKEEEVVKTSSRFGRARKKVNYSLFDQEESEEEEDESDAPPNRKKALSTKKAARGRKKVSHDDDDDSEAMVDSSEEDDDLDDVVVSEDEDDSSEEEEAVRPVKRKGGKKAAGKKPIVDSSAKDTKEGKKKMSESFKPSDVPLFSKLSLEEIKKTKEYLDPCGMEATDDIIDRLVGDQVDKIGELLVRALKSNDSLGSSVLPMKLGTACSGTDAPSLAMTLVQEQMELKGLNKLFHFDHKFSCELEPFKQAYLARNFDSVLYPDIVKLTDEEPRDVYGQVQNIPEFNLFVAGTSCKNFSMLRSTKRIDIEDKGCSGETFLAAVEVLFKEKPAFAIFENVQNAPWVSQSLFHSLAYNLSFVSL